MKLCLSFQGVRGQQGDKGPTGREGQKVIINNRGFLSL